MSLSEVLQKYSKKSSHEVFVISIKTSLGNIVAAADDEFLYMAVFEDSKNKNKHIQALSLELICSFVERKNKLLESFEIELYEYLLGKLKKFTVPIKTFGSDFQKEVWNELLNIPYASTQTYGDLAKALGRPGNHSRAVGGACGANPHIIVVPCHRIVAANRNGAAFNEGFSCGIHRKKWLIQHEKKFCS